MVYSKAKFKNSGDKHVLVSDSSEQEMQTDFFYLYALYYKYL